MQSTLCRSAPTWYAAITGTYSFSSRLLSTGTTDASKISDKFAPQILTSVPTYGYRTLHWDRLGVCTFMQGVKIVNMYLLVWDSIRANRKSTCEAESKHSPTYMVMEIDTTTFTATRGLQRDKWKSFHSLLKLRFHILKSFPIYI